MRSKLKRKNDNKFFYNLIIFIVHFLYFKFLRLTRSNGFQNSFSLNGKRSLHSLLFGKNSSEDSSNIVPNLDGGIGDDQLSEREMDETPNLTHNFPKDQGIRSMKLIEYSNIFKRQTYTWIS